MWIVMPVLAGPEMTEAAINDCLAQDREPNLLIINQGVSTDFRRRLEDIAIEYDSRICLWSHDPPLLSLGTSWNRALDFVWQTGDTEALVINNDVRLDPRTYVGLLGCLNVSDNLFVSAVGVTPEQFDERGEGPTYWYDEAKRDIVAKGGPDFSCFLISKACHDEFRFDENFIPAYCEDLDYHRRLMLAGKGAKIFSVNLPYLHLAAQTLKQVDPKKKAAIERTIESGSRAYYAKKWGGPVNQETFWYPFDREGNTADWIKGRCSPTTPAIQAWTQQQLPTPVELAQSVLKEALESFGAHPALRALAEEDAEL